MKRLLLLLFTTAGLLSFGNSKIAERIDYIQNTGQWESPVLFKANLFGGWVFLEKDALTFKFIENHHHHPAKSDKDDIIKGHVYKINWLNANPDAKVIAEDKQPYYNNYFIGNNQSKWKSNVGNFQTIRYKNIYPNIDFKIYSEATSMKSDYIIHKNGDVQSLKFKYDGVDAISVEKDGKLKITTSINTIYEYKPYAYQLINGKQVEVVCNYTLNNTTLSFQLPNGYDKTTDLIIDPTLVFSTYSGSISDNWGSSATHDNAGNMFLGGIALGASYPTTVGAFQTTFAGGSGFQFSDIAITKFNATGTTKLYSTYLGGSSNELLASLLCTPNNELIAVMTTGSSDFPTTANAFDRTFNGGSSVTAYEISMENGADIAITKLNEVGSTLIGSTFLGGSGNDGTNTNTSTSFNYGDASRSDVALDNNGNIYVTSTTTSTNIPNTAGKAQANNGGGSSDGLLAKFNSDLSVLNWASYFGGTGTDASYSMALDKNNNIFICGGTNSSDIPGRTSGLNTSYRGGSTDGFTAKFDNNGNSVLASTYLGTNAYDQAYIMDLDNDDNVYFFGQTLGLYPVTSGVYSNTGAPQFIHKLNNNLNNTIFSTVFGSVNSTEINITPTALLVDVCSNIYAVGWGGNVNNSGNTFSMAVTPDAFKSTTDGSDFYLFNLSANATNLIYASYFGENGGVGDHVDGGTSRFDKSGIVYEAVCASCGGTNSFPVTSGVAGPDNNSFNCNMAGFKFNFDLTSLQIITATATPPIGCAPLAVDFTYTATKPGTEYFWDFGDGTTSTSRFPSHTYSAAGTYNVRFILRDPLNCNPVDSTTLTVNAGQRKTNTINKTICEGQSVTIGNQTFTTSGNYNVTLQAVGGCDSVVTLNLSVTNEIINNINQTICEGEIVAVGNSRYTQPGNYSDTIPTSALCDSIVNLTLTVKPKKYINLNRTICQGQSVTAGNQTFNTSGNFTVTIQSSLGCDSIISLNLLVNPVKTSSITNTICDGKSVTIGNQTFSEDGSYTISLTTSEGCDSIVNLTLIVNPLPEINAVADRTTAFPDEQIQLNVLSTESLSYNWTPIELLNNSTIQNPTAFITTPTWFVVSAENKTTLCTIEDSVFIGLDFLPCLKENIFIPNAFTPNGDDVNDKLFVRTTILNSFHFEIYDRWGNKVFSTDSITEGWDGNYKGQPAQVETYGYFLSGECIQGEKISLKGNLTLLR
jgi:gliding motility-associated-like protein